MEYWRRCCGMTISDRKTNEGIRIRMKRERSVADYVEEKILAWCGHV